MPQVGFEPTSPVFKGVKTFHALHHMTTVIGIMVSTTIKILRYSTIYSILCYCKYLM